MYPPKSDTPRTDAEYAKLSDPATTFYADGWDWARQLERELIQALRVALEGAAREKELADRVYELTVAREAALQRLTDFDQGHGI